MITKALEKGLIPWRKHWHPDPNRGGPTRLVSGSAYQGVDYLTLQLETTRRNSLGRWWGTSKQWGALGGAVRGTGVTVGEQVVFNVDQVDGENDKLDQLRPDPDYRTMRFPDYESAQKLIDATKAEIRFVDEDEAFYERPSHTGGDYIQAPPRRKFIDIRGYFETIFHELIHWSEIRRNWIGSCAAGELVAEIGSCFIANELNIPHSDYCKNHHKYVAQWIEEMKKDSSYISRHANEASKACEYILSLRK